MIDVSSEYKEAVRADVRRTHLRLEALIVSPDLLYGAAATSGVMGYADDYALNDGEETIKRYAALEPGRWALDGTYDLLPDSGKAADAGYVFSALSGAVGAFSEAQTLRREFSGVTLLRALTVCFSSDEADGVADSFTVRIYRGETAAFQKSFTGNRAARVVIDGVSVSRPTAYEIEIAKWSLPHRRARVAEILPDKKYIWTEDDLTDFSVKHQTDVSCQSMPYGTCEITINDEAGMFDPRNEYGIFDTLEERQSVSVSVGVKKPDESFEYVPLGVFYQQGGGWKTGTFSRLIKWRLVDIIGLLSEREFSVSYQESPVTLSGWAAAIVKHLGTSFEDKFYVDPEYADMTIWATGGGVISTCGEVLRQICLASGTFFRADQKTGKLCIEPLPSRGGETDLSDLTAYPTFEANEEAASVTVMWTDPDAPDGHDERSFTINGNSTAAAKDISFYSPFIHDEETARAVCSRVISAYGGTKYEIRGRGDPARELGDAETVTLERTAVAGRRIYQDFSYEGGVLQKCKSILLRANGLFLFTVRAEFTENGTFSVPGGVSELRVILVGGGDGGAYGRNVRTSGEGGYVYEADISVTAGETYAVHIGAGGRAGESCGASGGETTFGALSSRAGRRYSPAYTDLASGRAYAMRGFSTEPPEEGTGNGGHGFFNGAGGAVIIYYREADDA